MQLLLFCIARPVCRKALNFARGPTRNGNGYGVHQGSFRTWAKTFGGMWFFPDVDVFQERSCINPSKIAEIERQIFVCY